jgi:hypothetical protein
LKRLKNLSQNNFLLAATSVLKQEVNMEAAQELKKAVDEIAEMFAKAKAAAKK